MELEQVSHMYLDEVFLHMSAPERANLLEERRIPWDDALALRMCVSDSCYTISFSSRHRLHIFPNMTTMTTTRSTLHDIHHHIHLHKWLESHALQLDILRLGSGILVQGSDILVHGLDILGLELDILVHGLDILGLGLDILGLG